MFGLKNLMPKGVLCDTNYAVLRKKSDEYKRSLQYFTGHIQQMVKIYLDYFRLFEANLNETMNQLNTNKEANCSMYIDIVTLFCSLNRELERFIERASKNQKSLNELSNVFITDYNVLTQSFQTKAREYFQMEQKLIYSCKKYFALYKEMLAKIEAYKNSFMDVKLIYNSDEKIRLYSECTKTYKQLEQFAASIQTKVEDLNKSKFIVIESYKILSKQLINFTIAFASRYIDQFKKFFDNLFDFVSSQLQVFVEKSLPLEKGAITSYFQADFNYGFQEIIDVQVNPALCRLLPSFIVYKDRLTENGVHRFKRCLVNYLHEMTFKSEKRRKVGRKIMDFIKSYIRNQEKSMSEWIRETLQSFEKMRKKIGQAFGSRWIGFYKIVAALFENYIENTGRLVLRIAALIQRLQNFIAQQSNLMGDFIKELKTLIQQFVPKKLLRKQIKDEDISKEEKMTKREQITKVSEEIKNLIIRYSQAGNLIYEDGKGTFLEITKIVKQSLSEYFIFYSELQNTYYNQEEYARSYQLFQDEMSSSVKKGMEFFDTIELAVILKETNKITFDNEFNKIEGFKKIKKPKEFEEPDRQSYAPMENNSTNSAVLSLTINKDNFIGESNSRNAEFLMKRVILEEDQKYLKSYSCSLSDAVILAGRLYVTSHRICFHSKFNSKNIFFGETFIDIPSKDIKKIEKRSMSVISDNAISITTVNGQLVFRSFFSRDQCFDIIRKTFTANSEQIFFQQEQEDGDPFIQVQMEFADDLKEEAARERQAKLQKELKQWKYQMIYQEEFTSIGLTVVKYLKIFELDQEVIVNRVPFSSFLYYFKDLMNCKEIQIEPWKSNPLQFLNVLNIKESSPQIFTRKVKAVTPMPPSNVPFMPKTSLVNQQLTMYLMSKDKVVIETVVNSSGVPYSDTFDVRLKKVIVNSGENTVKVSNYLYVNFTQNVMMKSTIEAKTFQSTKDSLKLQCQEIKSYLKALEKKILKGGKKESPEQKIKDLEEQISELEQKLKQTKAEKKQVMQQSSRKDQKFKKMQILVVVLIAVILIESLLFYTSRSTLSQTP